MRARDSIGVNRRRFLRAAAALAPALILSRKSTASLVGVNGRAAKPALSGGGGGGGDPLDLPLVPLNEIAGLFTYLGEFDAYLGGGADAGNFAFCGGGFGADTDGIWMGKDQSVRIGKMSIPAFNGSASLTVALTDVPGDVGASSPNQKNASSMMTYGGRLLITAFTYYDPSGDQDYWIRSATTNLSSFGPWCGMSANRGASVRHFAGGLMEVPEVWQDTLGGTMACVGGGMGTVANACNGPGLGIFDPSLLPTNGSDGSYTVPVDTLLHYPLEQTLINYDPPNYYQTEGNPHLGQYIIPGSRTLIFVHVHGTGSSSACDAGSSVPAAPYRIQILPYDLQDLVDVKNGVIAQPYTPKPYGWVEFPDWDSHWNTCVGTPGGHTQRGAFNVTNKRLYLAPDGIGASNPIKVWSIADYS